MSSNAHICPTGFVKTASKRYAKTKKIYNYWKFMNKTKAMKRLGHEHHFMLTYPRNGCTSIRPIVVPDGTTWRRCVERLQDIDGNGSSMVQHRAVKMDVVQNEQPHVISCRFFVAKKEFKVEHTIWSYRLIATTWSKNSYIFDLKYIWVSMILEVEAIHRPV